MDSLRQPSAWLLAISGAILYAWAPTTVSNEHLAGAADVPGWLPVVAPPLLYGLLLTGLPRVQLARRLAGAAALCVGYVLLNVATAALYAAIELWPPGDMSPALLWAYPAAAIVQLLAVPLVFFPCRDLLTEPRRRRRGRAAGARRMPTPPLTRGTSVWDADLVGTAGGERLREEDLGRELTPEWRRALQPPRPTPGPRPPLARTPTPAPLVPRQPDRLPRPDRPGIFETKASPPAPLPVSPQSVAPAVREAAHPAPAIETTPAPAASVLAPEPPALLPSKPILSAAIAPPPAPVVEPAPARPIVPRVEPPLAPTLEATAVAVEAAPPVSAPPTPAPAASTPPTLAPAPEAGPVEAVPRPDHAAETRRIAARLRPVGRLPVTTHALMGVTLFTACSPRLAHEVVVRSAFRFLAALMQTPGPHPVTQATLRGAAGAMVLTPLGPLRGGGPVLVAAVPTRGSLALLEVLSRRIAAEQPAAGGASASPDVAAHGPAAATELRPAPVPPRVDTLARAVDACGDVAPIALQDPTGQVLLYLLVKPGVDGRALGRFARDVYQVMEVDDDPGGVGPVHSIVLRLGDERVVIRPVTEVPGRSTLLVAGGGEDRPGLAQLQLDRVAARLPGA